MRPTYLRDITEEEKNKLYAMIDDDSSERTHFIGIIISQNIKPMNYKIQPIMTSELYFATSEAFLEHL